ncbi:MAG: STAS domain-containing protein, partial [Pseudorhodoplanes sp.]
MNASDDSDMTQAKDVALVRLSGILDLAAAAGLQQEILHALSAAGRVRFDASQVEVMLVPCLQVILAAMRSANVAVEQPSPAFESAFAELGLDFRGLVAAAAKIPAAAPKLVMAQSEMPKPETPADMPVEVATGPLRILTIDDSKTMRDML